MYKSHLFVLISTILLKSAIGQTDYLSIGNKYLANEEYSNAEKTFREATKSDPSNTIYQCQLALALLNQQEYKDAQTILTVVLSRDTANVGALWYSGLNNFQNEAGDLRKAIMFFEKALLYINKNSRQFYSGNWFIGQSYHILLQTDGLTYNEVSKMLECYAIYLQLQPDADDAKKISSFVQHIKEIRPSSNVEKWVNKS